MINWSALHTQSWHLSLHNPYRGHPSLTAQSTRITPVTPKAIKMVPVHKPQRWRVTVSPQVTNTVPISGSASHKAAPKCHVSYKSLSQHAPCGQASGSNPFSFQRWNAFSFSVIVPMKFPSKASICALDRCGPRSNLSSAFALVM